MTDINRAIAANIAEVRARIAAACERSGRSAESVTVIGISKTHAADLVMSAHSAGLVDFGENRVQEASAKIAELHAAGVAPNWHLVGNLQRNKVGKAVQLFDVIHSVDSERLAADIAFRSLGSTRMLLEVNVAGEASKSGVAPADAVALAESIGDLHHAHLIGLMTVAPETDDAEQVRPVFRALRELRDAIGLSELSMGMTGDFEVAVEEGATFVRVGRAIFGARAT